MDAAHRLVNAPRLCAWFGAKPVAPPPLVDRKLTVYSDDRGTMSIVRRHPFFRRGCLSGRSAVGISFGKISGHAPEQRHLLAQMGHTTGRRLLSGMATSPVGLPRPARRRLIIGETLTVSADRCPLG